MPALALPALVSIPAAASSVKIEIWLEPLT
jgi:hypothetical protein